MTNKPCEPDDPLELVGVALPAQDEASLREMAICFVEEFARDGWTDDQLRAMFRNPCYRGPHLVWRQKGDAYVESVIRQVRDAWRPAEGGNGR